jgi:hypothetical protein
MSSKRQGSTVVYWDSCIFFAWIKDELLPESVKKGIEQTIEKAYKGEAVIATSVVALTEVLQSKMTADQKEKFKEIFHHPHLQMVDVDRRIAAKAAVVREHYDTRTYDKNGNKLGGSFMSLGDSLHVATAIHISVREMHTLDGAGKHTKRLDLLKLNGNVAGIKLVIVQPYYVPPPEHLHGPVTTLKDTGQMELREIDNEKDAKAIAPSAPVPGSAPGSTEGEAGTESKGAQGEAAPQSEVKDGPASGS